MTDEYKYTRWIYMIKSDIAVIKERILHVCDYHISSWYTFFNTDSLRVLLILYLSMNIKGGLCLKRTKTNQKEAGFGPYWNPRPLVSEATALSTMPKPLLHSCGCLEAMTLS